ncbi:MAG: hypothetical protein LBT56_07165, partial [Prevotellaceae bacterium]|nr:hypothetical protein [Prevotellaceae bacterium]
FLIIFNIFYTPPKGDFAALPNFPHCQKLPFRGWGQLLTLNSSFFILKVVRVNGCDSNNRLCSALLFFAFFS